jgi:hypothetical protein
MKEPHVYIRVWLIGLTLFVATALAQNDPSTPPGLEGCPVFPSDNI